MGVDSQAERWEGADERVLVGIGTRKSQDKAKSNLFSMFEGQQKGQCGWSKVNKGECAEMRAEWGSMLGSWRA